MRAQGNSGEFHLTGRHVFMMFVAFFGVVIAVNLVMARYAVGYWTGLVVENSYVASQEFNAKIRVHEQIAERGWKEDIAANGQALHWGVIDADGKPVQVRMMTVVFNRPVGIEGDTAINGVVAADGTVADIPFPAEGRWNVTVRAELPDGLVLESIHHFDTRQSQANK